MADTGIFATTAQVQAKVGVDGSTTYNAESYINQYMAEAESYINSVTGMNYSDLYASLNADTKRILSQAASDLAAMYVINADPSGFGLSTAQTKLNFLWARFLDNIARLKEDNVRKNISTL
jgi:hypothetical protein